MICSSCRQPLMQIFLELPSNDPACGAAFFPIDVRQGTHWSFPVLEGEAVDRIALHCPSCRGSVPLLTRLGDARAGVRTRWLHLYATKEALMEDLL